MKRIDISMERTRVYGYQDRNLEIDNPLMLFITEEGGHRVQDTVGWVHYVPKGWQTLKWLPKNLTANHSKAFTKTPYHAFDTFVVA